MPSKICVQCGREITWRKKWERNWAEVKYCSDACRRRKGGDAAATVDAVLEASILHLLSQRAATATICPSEAARAVSPDGWRALMEPARQAARRLVVQRKVQILQDGRVVDPSRAKGPIRLKLVKR